MSFAGMDSENGRVDDRVASSCLIAITTGIPKTSAAAFFVLPVGEPFDKVVRWNFVDG
jgi:hypothetical protein